MIPRNPASRNSAVSTLQPVCCNAFEIAAPMPRLPPVTNATRATTLSSPVLFRLQPRSTHMAMPMPPPMHSVAKPFFAPRRCIS